MELIDRDVLRKELAYMWYDNCNLTAKDIEKAVFDAPTVDVVPVRHEKWIVTAGGKECDCPVCGEWFDNTCNYDIRKTWKWCPVCGTKMDGE